MVVIKGSKVCVDKMKKICEIRQYTLFLLLHLMHYALLLLFMHSSDRLVFKTQ